MHERAFQLRLADGLVYAEREGKHLFLQPATPDWMVVSQNGAILLSRCVGATLEEILGDAGESLWEQALDLFSEALGRGLLVDSSKAQQGLERTKLASCGTQQALATVHLKLTNQCNLGCSYCYAESGTRTSVLEWEDLSLISRHVAAISKTVSYVLSGGEPLLHSRALDFAEKVRSDGNQVHLLTNGTLIDESNATRIAAAADLVKISLDGSTERIHATTRGRGNFAKVTRAIELLIRCGANVVVAMTVTQRNRSDIAAMVSRYGSRLALQPLFNAGRGIAANDLALTGREYYKALAAVDGVEPMGALDVRLKLLRGRGVRRCAMAEREMSIAENGDVFPCQLLHDDRFRAGNLHSNTLSEIYEHSPIFARMRRMNVDSLAKCSTCAVRYLCGGACRARDLFETGSEEVVGDFCEYEREALLAGIFETAELRAV